MFFLRRFFFFKCFSLPSEASLSSLLEFRCIFSNGFVFFSSKGFFFSNGSHPTIGSKGFFFKMFFFFPKKRTNKRFFCKKKNSQKKRRLVVTKNVSF